MREWREIKLNSEGRKNKMKKRRNNEENKRSRGGEAFTEREE